jgi:flagellar hook-basal body complex protein FliE
MRIDKMQNNSSLISGFDLSNKKTDVSFKKTLSSLIRDVNHTQKESSAIQARFLSGEITDVSQVMLKSEEANVSFNMLMELRNKGLDVLNEVMRTKL